MSRTKLVKKVKQLRKQGLSFRAIEQRMPKTLGLSESGNGTRAFRLANA